MECYRITALLILAAISWEATSGEDKGNTMHILASYLKHLLAKPAALKTLHQLGLDYLNHASIFNTTVDFTIPLFSFSLPTKEDPQDSTAVARQNLLGQAIFLSVVVVCFVASIALPVLINRVNMDQTSQDKGRASNVLDVVVGECFLRTICESHRHPNNFGLVGHLVTNFFPYSSADDNSPIGMAARLGACDTRQCQKLYGCPYSLLQAARFIATVVQAYVTS